MIHEADGRPSPVSYFRLLAGPWFCGHGDHGTERYLFGGLEVWLRPMASGLETIIELYWIGALQPRRGEGSAGIRALGELADRAGLELLLYADPWGRRGRMGREALRHCYQRFGFNATTAQLVNYWPRRRGLEMRSFPQTTDEATAAPKPKSTGSG